MKINHLDYLHDVAKLVVKDKINPTAEYKDWIIFTIASASFGEEAREDYLKVCSTYPGYSEEECNEKFDNCLKSSDGKRKGKMLHNFFEEQGVHVDIPKRTAEEERKHINAVKDEEMIRLHCPTLKGEVFKDMPNILFDGMELYRDHEDTYGPRLRDVLYLGMLNALSNCFPTARMPYDTDRFSLNTYFIVTGSSASGKRLLKYGMLLLDAINEQTISEYMLDHKEWEHSNEEWQLHKKRLKKGETLDYSLEPGEEPRYSCFIIPANTSKSMILDIMKASEKNGNVLYTTELLTYNTAVKQDCGQFDDVILKAAGNEPTDKAFRVDGTPIRISYPMLGISASGTKDQAHQFIKTYMTGFGSRVPLYQTEQADKFYNTKPKANLKDYGKVYGDIAMDVLDMWNKFRNYNFVVEFTDEQWADHFATWGDIYDEVFEEQRELQSVVNRSAIYILRLAGTLSMLRLYDNMESMPEDYDHCTMQDDCYHVICTDQDYKAASNIAQTLFQHSMMFAASKVKRENPYVKTMEEWRWQYQCLDQMPETFSSADFIHAAINDYEKSDKTAYTMLAKLSKGKGKKIRQLKDRVNSQRMFKKIKAKNK